MKKLKIFLAAAIAAIVSVAAGIYSYNAAQENLLTQEQELALVDENVEALSAGESLPRVMFEACRDAFNKWYDSKVYQCVLCSETVIEGDYIVPAISVGYGAFYVKFDIQRTVRKRVEYYWDCKAGSDYAHCDECKGRPTPASHYVS